MTAERTGPLLRSLLRGQWRGVTGGTVLVTLHQGAEAAVPVVIGLAVDAAIATRDAGALVVWLGALVGVFAVLAPAGLGGYYLLERAGLRVEHDVRQRLVASELADAGTAERRTTGELLSLADSDARAVGEVASLAGIAAGVVPALLGAATILLQGSVLLGVVVLLGVAAVVLLVPLLGRPLVERSEAEQAAVAASTARSTDLLRGLRVLKGLGAEAAAVRSYRVVSGRTVLARVRAARAWGGFEAATRGASGVLLVVVAGVGGGLALNGTITTGELVVAVGLAQFLVGPLTMVSGIGAELAAVRASAGRVQRRLRTPPAVSATGTSTPSGPGRLALRGVVAGPLRDLDLDLPAGALIGLAAPPAEATQVVDLLGRRLAPEIGTVLLDDCPAEQIGLGEWRRRVLVARHDDVLLAGSVRDNLTAVDVSVLDDVLEAASVDDVLRVLPGGLDGPVGERGRNLSGGQRQRVALARALAAHADVLVLHDPTTALDPVTELAVADGVARLRRGRSTLLVTTSPALLARCVDVIVLHEGRVAGRGPHDLLSADPRYRDLVLQ